MNYAADESWGPKMDGRMYRPWWSWYPGTPEYGQQTALNPQPDNIRDFFDLGMTVNNNVALSGGSDETTFRLSYTNIYQEGTLPNSRLNRHNLSVNAESRPTDKLTFGVSLNLALTDANGRPQFGYQGDYNPVMSFNQWFQRQLDMDRLRDYRNADGTTRSWNIRSATNLRPLYWDSPYFTVFENAPTDNRNRYFGNIKIAYEIMDGLTVNGYVRRDAYSQRFETRNASGGLSLDRYGETVVTAREDNYELLVQYFGNFGDISLNANLGGNIRYNHFHSNGMSTAGGLNAPFLYNIKASTDRPNVSSSIRENEVRSIYGAVSLGWKDMVFLDATLRNDWSSALPEDNNSYLYPSISGSFIVSELFPANPIISFAKVRASFAQVGSDIGPYQTNFTYGAGTPYGTTPTFSLPNQLINEDLRPALSSAYEVGLELRFLDNRLGLDVAVYRQDNEDQILSLTVPGSSGFSSAIINAGNIRSEGLEIALTGTPIRTTNFTWDIAFNLATNTSEVVELADGIDNRRLDGWGWGGLSINAPVGEEWGTFRGRAYKRFQATDSEGNSVSNPSNGQIVISEAGRPQFENNQDLGTLLPDWTGGIRNTITFMNFDLTAFVEFQVGGQFHSVTKMFNAYSGLSTETTGNNALGNPVRDPVDQGGGVTVTGVLEDGTPHSAQVDAQTYWSSYLFALNEHWMYDASYAKLREVRLGYTLPKRWFAGTPIQNLNLAFIGRNLWLISSNVDGIDPSEISPGSSNYVFQENGILPGVRSYGVNLKIGF